MQWGPENEAGMTIEENVIVMPDQADFRKADLPLVLSYVKCRGFRLGRRVRECTS